MCDRSVGRCAARGVLEAVNTISESVFELLIAPVGEICMVCFGFIPLVSTDSVEWSLGSGGAFYVCSIATGGQQRVTSDGDEGEDQEEDRASQRQACQRGYFL